MNHKEHNPNWGGARTGAGRKRKSSKLAKDSTKVVRVSFEVAELIQSGKLAELLAVIEDWNEQIANASKTSPRWSRARAMMDEIQHALNDKWGK